VVAVVAVVAVVVVMGLQTSSGSVSSG
jgi:hypothetical protein